jgi:hypothetical protein
MGHAWAFSGSGWMLLHKPAQRFPIWRLFFRACQMTIDHGAYNSSYLLEILINPISQHLAPSLHIYRCISDRDRLSFCMVLFNVYPWLRVEDKLYQKQVSGPFEQVVQGADYKNFVPRHITQAIRRGRRLPY